MELEPHHTHFIVVDGATAADEGEFELSLRCELVPTPVPTPAPTGVPTAVPTPVSVLGSAAGVRPETPADTVFLSHTRCQA